MRFERSENMDFFRPSAKLGGSDNTRMTAANINKDSEERLKGIKEKRKDRREKINTANGSDRNETNSIMRENDKLRKNKDMTRKEFNRSERRDLSRLGFNTKSNPMKNN